MIEYWLQNGEAYALRNGVNVEKVNEKELRDALMRIFQIDGKLTIFSKMIFSQIIPDVRKKYNSQIKNDEKIGCKWISKYLHTKLNKTDGKGSCSICGAAKANIIKGWIYPFIVAFEKFPNLYPAGKVKSLFLCQKCATLSILAYNGVFFNAQGQDYISLIFFFSNSSEMLNRIMGAYLTIEPKIATDSFKNIKLDVIVYFPYEFLAYIIYKIASSIEKINITYEDNLLELNAVIAGIIPKQKKLYLGVSIINRVETILLSMLSFIEKFSDDAFKQMYTLMRMSEDRTIKANQFIEREKFFKYLLKYKKINWNAALNLIIYRLELDQRINFISDFIRLFLEKLDMNEKELFDMVSGLGYRLGKSIIKKEKNIKKAKKYIYELRRSRRLSEFLDKINHIQLDLETTIDDRPFRENPERFEDLKSMFLIDMCNGIFTINSGGDDKNEG